tara:strand:- start:1876 stop:2541 length:666 start_codon:yes stop_codon:yes gene_type:complete
MNQKVISFNLNNKVEFHDLEKLSFHDEIKKKVENFIIQDNHCILLKGEDLISSYIFQAFYHLADKNFKTNYISIIDGESDFLYGPQAYDFVFVDAFNKCFENESLELNLFNLYNSTKLNGIKLVLNESSSINKKILLPDLKSRINSNFEIIIPRLTHNDKKNIIEIELSKRGININKNCLNFIMNHSSRNHESLQNLVNKLDLLTMERKKNITIPLIKELI